VTHNWSQREEAVAYCVDEKSFANTTVNTASRRVA